MLTRDSWLKGASLIIIFISCILIQKIFVSKFDLVAGNLIANGTAVVIHKGIIISQPLIANKDGLSTIKILINKQETIQPEDGTITWRLSSGDGESILAQGEIPTSAIKKSSFNTLEFAPIDNSDGKYYMLEITSSIETDGFTLSSSLISQSRFYSYQLNSNDQNGTIVFYTGYSTPDFNRLIVIRGSILSIPLWILFLSRKKAIRFLEEQHLHLAVTGVIMGVGLMMIVIQPPLHMFDEPEHFRRVWEVSTGKFLPSKENGVASTRLPEYIQETLDRIYRSVDGTTQNPAQIHQMLVEPAGDEKSLSSTQGLISTYTFFAYLIPGLFVRIGIWMGSSALGLMYLARLANLIMFSALMYWTLKHSRIGRQTIAAVAMLGLVITQGAAINVDSLVMAGSFLFLASVFNLIWSDDSSVITKKDLIPLLAGMFCVLISKHIYIPIFALVILIPASRFGGAKEKWKQVLTLLLVAGLFSILMQLIISLGRDPRIDTSNINPLEQFEFILRSPVNWIKVFTQTLVNNGLSYYDQFNRLNGTHTSIGIFGIVQLAGVLFFSWSDNDSSSGHITNWQRIYSFSIAIITSMFIMLPLYLYWTPVEASLVNGIQGRYFLPIIVLILIVSRPNLTYGGQYIKTKLLGTMIGLLLVQLWMIYTLFY